MDWLRSLLLASQTTRQPVQPPEANEPPHTHEEFLEPEQLATCEVRADGRPSVNAVQSLNATSGSAGFLQCIRHNEQLLIKSDKPLPDRPDVRIRIREAAPETFTRRTISFRSLVPVAKRINGTKIRLRFDNVPAGLSIFVNPTVPFTLEPPPLESALNRQGYLQLVATDRDGKSPASFEKISNGDARPVQISMYGRVAYATYEVIEIASPSKSVHQAIIGVYLAFISNTGQSLPTLGQSSVTVGFAPGSGATSADSNPLNLFRIDSCTADLLFPFVTNRGGQDTKIIISNTSSDPFGTMPEKGAITLFFYGGNKFARPQPITSPAIEPGMQWTFDLSSHAPDFEGYIVAIAKFRYCYGTAIISDSSDRGGSHSYVAVNLDGNGTRTGQFHQV